MIGKIRAISKDEMRMLRSMRKFEDPFTAAISITDPDAAKVFSSDTPNIATLVFNDITPLSWNGVSAAVDEMKFMTTFDARKIVWFIHKLKNSEIVYDLWINCSAGINRSGSVARYAQRHSNVSIEEFLSDNPQIKGNDWVSMKLCEAEYEVGLYGE